MRFFVRGVPRQGWRLSENSTCSCEKDGLRRFVDPLDANGSINKQTLNARGPAGATTHIPFLFHSFSSSTMKAARNPRAIDVSFELNGPPRNIRHEKSIMYQGLQKQRDGNSGCMGWRSMSSVKGSELVFHESKDSELIFEESTEANINAHAAENWENCDFRNFPALESSFFENCAQPSDLRMRKKRFLKEKRSHHTVESKIFRTDSFIPEPRGRRYDFGFTNAAIQPPPLEPGARPQGGFDIDIKLDSSNADTDEASSDIIERHSFVQNLSAVISETSNINQNAGESNFETMDNSLSHSEDDLFDLENESLWDPYNIEGSESLFSASSDSST
ncbi:hypothetical protein KP509_39G057900 [Ceratopteris richardii]|uniref:Uncharacterized protein n=1 Tax=Ceratopteris richardii TaxID=49495 RepID=A0A8T2Q1S8_CERRI|nr:hypothetical protein KP509_39G057900 [Ceratopteris richardii]